MVQLPCRHIIAVSFLVLFYITENKSAVSPKLKYLKADETVIFSNQLSSIANLNKERMNALNRYTELENYSTGDGILRHAEETKKDPLVAILMLNNDYNGAANDGLLYEDDNSLITPRETPVEDIFDLKSGPYDSNDNEEVDKFKLRSLIANLNNEAMRNNLGLDIYESGIIPIMEGTIPVNTETIEIGRDAIPVIPILSLPGVENKRNDIDSYNYNIRNDSQEIYDDKVILHRNNSEPHADIDVKTKNFLRWRGCSRKAEKTCVKACKCAYRNVCKKKYSCTSRFKSDLKKDCKAQCKVYFD